MAPSATLIVSELPSAGKPAKVPAPAPEEMESQLQHLSFGPNALSGDYLPHPPQKPLQCRLVTNAALGIPHFVSFQQHREHIVLHMAAVFRNWARVGFTEGISGHISVRDPEFPDCIWMNPIGRHFALLNASDMLCIEIDTGAIVGGNPVSARTFLHSKLAACFLLLKVLVEPPL
jgi:hypothetical protein